LVKPLHILLTDDDLDKRLILAMTISRAFPTASVFECHSGKEALEYFLKNRVDVLVTNHNMPGVTGVELIRAVRTRGAKIPIIMVTSHDELASEAIAAGADLVLDTKKMMGIGMKIREFLTDRGFLN
jgi:two-component system chemotaxis response regulator CheY